MQSKIPSCNRRHYYRLIIADYPMLLFFRIGRRYTAILLFFTTVLSALTVGIVQYIGTLSIEDAIAVDDNVNN